MQNILSPAQLKKLQDHKYSAQGSSLLEPGFQVFWRWLVEQMPLWVAPNLLTLIGLIVNISTSLLVFYNSPDAKNEIPPWVNLSCALGLFIYQCLDAIDGKQARRTNSSSPLGELFDHGCDSVSTVMVVLATCCAVRLGTSVEILFYMSFFGGFMFYNAHWTTYCTGTLQFGWIDVTESQVGSMVCFILSAFLSPSFWDAELPLPISGILVKYIPVIIVTMGGLLMLQRNLVVIFIKGGVGRNGSTVADTSVIAPMFPIISTIILAFVIAKKSTFNVYENHPCLYLVAFGIVCAKITNKLVVAHMSKSELTLLDSVFIGPILLMMNQYFNFLFDEYHVLWLCMLYVLIDFSVYTYIVCNQLCEHLNIYCFSISLPPRKARANSTASSKKK